MFRRTRRRRRPQAGQAIVIMAVAIIPALLMVGLIVDGGNAWSQQRVTQNAADAAADAGATVLAQKSAGKSPVPTDANVVAAVCQAGLDHGVLISIAGTPPAGCTTSTQVSYYTDFAGTQNLGALGAGIPSGAAGVHTYGTRQFDTFFVRIAGIDTFTAQGDAIARYGYYEQCLQGQQSGNCMPIAFYMNWVTCDKSGKSQVQDPATNVTSLTGVPIYLYICKGTGNWGWLDPSVIGQTFGGPITDPSSWFASNTGERANLLAGLNNYVGGVIMLPIYDCANTTPSPPTAPATCSDPSNAQRLSGMFNCNGSNCYYHIIELGAFHLTAYYSSGCPQPGGQNSTDCLYGYFQQFLSEGTITQNPISGPGAVCGANPCGGVRGVQLIK